MSDLYERSAAVMPPFALHKMPFGIDHASGSYLYTDDGRKILDFGSGIAVNNLGHNYPTVVKAVQKPSRARSSWPSMQPSVRQSLHSRVPSMGAR